QQSKWPESCRQHPSLRLSKTQKSSAHPLKTSSLVGFPFRLPEKRARTLFRLPVRLFGARWSRSATRRLPHKLNLISSSYLRSQRPECRKRNHREVIQRLIRRKISFLSLQFVASTFSDFSVLGRGQHPSRMGQIGKPAQTLLRCRRFDEVRRPTTR